MVTLKTHRIISDNVFWVNFDLLLWCAIITHFLLYFAPIICSESYLVKRDMIFVAQWIIGLKTTTTRLRNLRHTKRWECICWSRVNDFHINGRPMRKHLKTVYDKHQVSTFLISVKFSSIGNNNELSPYSSRSLSRLLIVGKCQRNSCAYPCFTFIKDSFVLFF